VIKKKKISLITKGQNNEPDKNAQLLATTTRNQDNLAGQKILTLLTLSAGSRRPLAANSKKYTFNI